MDLNTYIKLLSQMSFPKLEEFMTNDSNPGVKRPSGASFVQCLWIIEAEAYRNEKWFSNNLKTFLRRENPDLVEEEPPCVEEIFKAANNGNVEAQLQLGDMYRVGRLLEKNTKESFYWYKKAADAGDVNGIYKVGLCYDYGIGAQIDYEECAKFLQQAADKDLPDAQYKLAWQYEKGKGVLTDLSKAFQLLKKAATFGHIYAQYNLAVYYEETNREWSNPALSVEWYKEAALKGHSRAQNNLGYQFHNGRGVQKDYQMAYYWYKTAADQGHDCGQYNVGFMWHNGHGVPKNPKFAVEWYKRAADQGYSSAQKLLANIYSKGEEGIPLDHLQAVHYYILMSDKDDNAKKNLSNPDYKLYVNTYLSQHWPSLHPKLRSELKQAIIEMLYIFNEMNSQHDETNTTAILPFELRWLVCCEMIRVWPVCGIFIEK